MESWQSTVRVVVFFLVYGVFFEVVLISVRYRRHIESHVEFHAFWMIISGIIGLGVDVWFTIDNLEKLFTTYLSIAMTCLNITYIILFAIQLSKYQL